MFDDDAPPTKKIDPSRSGRICRCSSIAEIDERIALLEAEIVRLTEARAEKSARRPQPMLFLKR